MTSKPFIRGIIRSRRMTAYRCSFSFSIASAPSATQSTSKRSRRTMVQSNCRIDGSSSATRTRGVDRSSVAMLGQAIEKRVPSGAAFNHFRQGGRHADKPLICRQLSLMVILVRDAVIEPRKPRPAQAVEPGDPLQHMQLAGVAEGFDAVTHRGAQRGHELALRFQTVDR